MSEPVPQQPVPGQPGLTGLPEGATVTGISQPEQQPAPAATVETQATWQADAQPNTAPPAPLPEVTQTQPPATKANDVTVRFTHAPGLDYKQIHDNVWFPNKHAIRVPADLAAKVLELPGFTLADASELAPVRQP